MHLLFVCTGNICRSPTAERLARAFAAEHGVDGLTASSAGTRAVSGYGMEPTASEVLRRIGGGSASSAGAVREGPQRGASLSALMADSGW